MGRQGNGGGEQPQVGRLRGPTEAEIRNHILTANRRRRLTGGQQPTPEELLGNMLQGLARGIDQILLIAAQGAPGVEVEVEPIPEEGGDSET